MRDDSDSSGDHIEIDWNSTLTRCASCTTFLEGPKYNQLEISEGDCEKIVRLCGDCAGQLENLIRVNFQAIQRGQP